MKTSGNTILITGGGSGIGFELAKTFGEHGNTVIICGRDFRKLQNAASKASNIIPIQCDITDSANVDQLLLWLKKNNYTVNILVNNAAKATAYFLGSAASASENAWGEIKTNYLAVVSLTEKLLPGFLLQDQSAVVNISSVVAIVPGLIVPTYSASKAALHSYTQSLRLSLAKYPQLKVFEVMPPVVDTEFSRAIPGTNRLSAELVASEIVKGIEVEELEMQIGATKNLFALHKEDPSAALAALNRLS